MKQYQIELMAQIATAKVQISELVVAAKGAVEQSALELCKRSYVQAVRDYFKVVIHTKEEWPNKGRRVIFLRKNTTRPLIGDYECGAFKTVEGVAYTLDEIEKWAYVDEVFEIPETLEE